MQHSRALLSSAHSSIARSTNSASENGMTDGKNKMKYQIKFALFLLDFSENA
jgi:triacylglycerol esterase/lipase EstA (alpha/beta hydrolase family)